MGPLQRHQAFALVPGLATSWGIDEADASKTKWIFAARGRHPTTARKFTAEAACNLDKITKKDSAQFDPRQSGQGLTRIPAVAGYRAIDKFSLEITTKAPDATLPYQIAWIMMSSPAQWEKVGKSWDAFARTPSGTGPWKLDKVVPRERAELIPFKEYWDKARVPRLDRLVLLPLPEANSRVAALRSGQVDWVEAPPPDAIPALKSAGFQIVSNAYPHNWTWHFSRAEGSPWACAPTQGLRTAVDRAGMRSRSRPVIPAEGSFRPATSGSATTKLVRQAAPEADGGAVQAATPKTKILISPSARADAALPMNEFVQDSAVPARGRVRGGRLNTLINIWRAGARHEARAAAPR